MWQQPGQPAGIVEYGRNIQQCDVDECSLYSCLNGGTCVDLGASFRSVESKVSHEHCIILYYAI